MENLTDLFKKQFNQEATSLGVSGIDQANARKEFTENKKSEEDDIRDKSTDYLKDDYTLSDVMKLVKNKKMNNNKIKAEIRKILKNPDELIDFLKSLIKKDKTETKEATGSGGGVGAYEGPLFGDMKEEDEIEEKWSKKYKDSIDCNNPKGFSQKAHCQGKVKKVETKEATSTASSGSYEGISIWAKTNSKKNWKPSRKTQLPGGKFVQVKKKCKTFPYCNQGDIKALKIFENETLKDIIGKVSNTYNLHEDHIKDIILYELRKTGK
jgi:hypothetical protein